MARNGKKSSGGREMVLESRHLVGLFLLMVVVSGVLFGLGYVLGRNQYETAVRAAGFAAKVEARGGPEPPALKKSSASSSKAQPPGTQPPTASDWDFYKTSEPEKKPARLDKPAPPPAATAGDKSADAPPPTAVRVTTQPKAVGRGPLIPRGAIVLQVAALTQESDALAVAESLQKKKFPAFVLTPGADKYYRVQVGPYTDMLSANAARKGLEQAGFKALIKR